eukprot:1155210-Pelagomonas_calceolata.AAC.3
MTERDKDQARKERLLAVERAELNSLKAGRVQHKTVMRMTWARAGGLPEAWKPIFPQQQRGCSRKGASLDSCLLESASRSHRRPGDRDTDVCVPASGQQQKK